ncbi:MAG: glycosyltransferase family 39 protein [Desulfobacterales bacterium]|jgi:tetratricopeptide (TPR) repeat protein
MTDTDTIEPKGGHPSRIAALFRGNLWIWVILLLAVSAGLRLAALLSLKESVYFDARLFEEQLYHHWAKSLAEGTFSSGQIYQFAPLPAYFMALVYRLFSPDIVLIRYANILFSVITCLLIFFIGKRVGGPGAGIVACAAAALYEPFIFYSIVPLKTSLAVALFAALALFVVWFAEGRSARSTVHAAAAGAMLGLLDSVQPNAAVLILILPVVFGWIAYRKKGAKAAAVGVLLFAVGLGAAHAPFLIRNYRVAGEGGLLPPRGGFYLYTIYNTRYPDGIPFVASSPAEQGVQFTIEASRRLKRTLTPAEAGRYWFGQALKEIGENPGYQTKELGKRLLEAFHWCERGDHYDISFTSRFAPFFKLPLVPFWAVLPFFIAGVVLGWHRHPGVRILALLVFGYGAGLVLFSTNARIRLPAVAGITPLAAVGLLLLIDSARGKNWRRFGIGCCAGAAAAIVSFAPVGNSGDLSEFYNVHAVLLDRMGKTEEAIGYWEASSQMKGRFSAYADLALAGKALSVGDAQRAWQYLDRVGNSSDAAADKHEMAGDIYLRARNYFKAVEEYRKALAINEGLRQVRYKLFRILQGFDPVRAHVEMEKLRYIDSFYTAYGPPIQPKKKAPDHNEP